MIILSIDPGNTTGYVLYNTDTSTLAESGDISGTLRDVIDFLLSREADVYICEDFRVRADMGPSLAKLGRLWSVEIIGCLRYLVEDKLILQHPAARPMFVQIPGGAHANDAAAHLYYWLEKNGYIEDYKVRIANEVQRRMENE